MSTTGKIRIAAVGDLHCRLGRTSNFRRLVDAVNGQSCDALLLCGDLTDRGLIDEAKVLADSLSRVRAPMFGVLGNHDLADGKGDEVVAILEEAGVRILDGRHQHLKGHLAGFAGVKGFAGGFEQASLQAFGEEAIKSFVYEAIDEAVKLEAALAQVDAALKIALTHYAPIRETCLGETPEIMPFLGTSRLREAIDAQCAAAAFHGHAHRGTVVGQTPKGIPVYNVALPLLRREHPERRVLIVDLPLPDEVADKGRELPPLEPDPAVVTPEMLGAPEPGEAAPSA